GLAFLSEVTLINHGARIHCQNLPPASQCILAWSLGLLTNPQLIRRLPREWLSNVGLAFAQSVVLASALGDVGAQTIQWSLAPPTPPLPPARSSHMLALDPATRDVIVYGGDGVGGAALADFWHWNGLTWAALLHTAPGARHYAAMVNVSSTRQVILFGGS